MGNIRAYLDLVESSDSSIAEHDSRYHKKGWREGMPCQLRDNIEKKRARVAAEKERQMELPFEQGLERQQLEEYARRIRTLDTTGLRKELDTIDDGEHQEFMKIWVAERDRRERGDLGKRMDDLGERA